MPKKTRKVSKKSIELLAESIHMAIAFTALSVYYCIQHASDMTLPEEVREKNIGILEGIISTSNTLYEDLDDEQRRLLREEAETFLEVSEIL